MSKNGWISGVLAVFLLLPALVLAEPEAPAPAVQGPPLTVSGVLIDKTDKNALLARAAALGDARREAFRKLAERNLPPQDFKAFTLPDDRAISAVVQDFEITREQLSTTRYVGTFTVRFRPAALALAGAGEEAEVPVSGPAPALVPPAAPARSLLVLPYYEAADGKVLLWEDGNAWMKAWQAAPPVFGGRPVLVPSGDITDVAAGSSDAVWSGGTEAVEKLRAAYSADEVVLAVAARAGLSMTIDLYSYRDGVIERLPSLTPALASEDETAAFRQGIDEVARALATRAAVEGAPGSPPPAVPSPADGVIEGQMAFGSFTQWMDLQKRVSAVSPPATLKIRALSSDSAAFVLRFDGDVETLRAALAAQGVEMADPDLSAEKPVYSFRLLE